MKKLIELYNKTGRIGNIILLVLLILSGVANRMFVAVKHKEIDYVIEIALMIAAAFLVKRIFDRQLLTIAKQSIFKGLLIAGLVLRIIFAVHDMVNRPVQDSDYEKHEKLGQRMAIEGEFYDFTGVELRNFRQPGLPAIFAVGILIYNHPVVYALIMIIFSFGVLLAAYYLFRDYKGIAALISFAYVSISPNMLFMASNSNTQLSFFFFLLLLFFMLKNYNGKLYQLIIIGAILAAELYIRFNFTIPFLLIPFFIEKHGYKKPLPALGKAAIVLASALVLYSPWIIRNYYIYGQLRLMPTTGLGLYSSNVVTDFTKAGGYNGVPDSLLTKYRNLSEMEFDSRMQEYAKEYIAKNPDIYVKGIPFRLMKFSGRQDWTISYFFQHTEYPNAKILEAFFQTVENFLLWIILFFPLMFLWMNKSLTPLSSFVLWAYLVYCIMILPISETRSRYNFPYVLFPVFACALAERRQIPSPQINGKHEG